MKTTLTKVLWSLTSEQLFLMQKKTTKMKKASSFEDTDTDQESSSSASRAPLHHSKYATHTDTHPSSTVCYTDTWERCPPL